MGGATKKFACTTSTGKAIRVKYTEPSKTSNREVFATVAASRLLWALGFTSHPVYPIALDCLDCPDDPTEGTGKKEKRSYLATYSPMFTDPALVDEDEADQGWKFGELDAAISALPAGELRSRQRQHFDALQLVGVLLQHGDRKPEQQRLSCHSALKARCRKRPSDGRGFCVRRESRSDGVRLAGGLHAGSGRDVRRRREADQGIDGQDEPR